MYPIILYNIYTSLLYYLFIFFENHFQACNRIIFIPLKNLIIDYTRILHLVPRVFNSSTYSPGGSGIFLFITQIKQNTVKL